MSPDYELGLLPKMLHLDIKDHVTMNGRTPSPRTSKATLTFFMSLAIVSCQTVIGFVDDRSNLNSFGDLIPCLWVCLRYKALWLLTRKIMWSLFLRTQLNYQLKTN